MWPPSESTQDLLREAREGSAEARERLLERHREGLRRMVELRLDRAVRRRLDASDIVQEVLFEAHGRLSDYLRNPPQPFHLWLRRIALDRIIDAHRRHRLAGKRSVDREEPLQPAAFGDRSSMELARQLEAAGPTPAAAAIRAELMRRFHAALERMGEDDREVLLLRHFEGLSNSETARALELSEPAAGMRYLRALRRLRALLEEGEGPRS